MPSYEQLLDNVYANVKARGTGERFECPLVDVLVQGSKTFIRNFDSVCAKLRRTPAEVSKYLFRELAVPGELQGGRLMLHSKFSPRQVNEKVQEYCTNYVICRECGKPDTNIQSSDDRGVRVLVCEACGAKHPIRK